MTAPDAKSLAFTTTLQRFLAALLLAGSVGCWEEIKYEPAPPIVQIGAGATVAPEQSAGETSAKPAGVGAPSPAADPLPGAASEVETAAETLAPISEPFSPPTGTPPLEPPPLDLPAKSTGDATAPMATPSEATPRQRLLIWQAASKWSLAAAMSARQLPAERYEQIRRDGEAAAAELGIELPPLAAPLPGQSLEQSVVATLGDATIVGVPSAIAERYGAAAAKLAELAIRSNLLLLTYSPRRSDLALQAVEMRAIAEASGLPTDAWTPLLKLLDEGAEYVAVRSAVFELHRRVESLLAEASR